MLLWTKIQYFVGSVFLR